MAMDSIKEILELCEAGDKSISDVVIEYQMELSEMPRETVLEKMNDTMNVMREAISEGLSKAQESTSGLTAGDANRYYNFYNKHNLPGGKLINSIIENALAVSEVNACMGRVVAAPTAGASGILPSVLFSLADEYSLDEEMIVKALLTASGIGTVISHRATLSGAQGGCQAECGSASAMAAAAGVEMLGGSPEMSAHACALALKNTLGLVCDPVAGLVEVPCIKRNVMGSVNALAAINMALAGIKSHIPADEVIDAMGSIGLQMHVSLRETAEGGLAATPTGRRIAKEVQHH